MNERAFLNLAFSKENMRFRRILAYPQPAQGSIQANVAHKK